MKRLLIFLSLLLGLSAQATDVFFNLTDFGASPATNRNVSIQMVSPFPGNVKQYFADSSGTFTFSNAPVAVYQVFIKAPPSQIPFMIQVLSTNLGTISASANTVASGTATFPAGTVAWSTLASDQRYFQGTNIDASGLQHGNQNITNWGNVSTNAYLSTNAASGFQPANGNLTNWAQLSTNVIGTGGGGGTGIQTNSGTGIGNSFTNAVFMNITNLTLSGDIRGNGQSLRNALSLMVTNGTSYVYINPGTAGNPLGIAGSPFVWNLFGGAWEWHIGGSIPVTTYGRTGASGDSGIWEAVGGRGYSIYQDGSLAFWRGSSETNVNNMVLWAKSNVVVGDTRFSVRTTNSISAYNFGSAAANGNYYWSGILYTNNLSGSTISNNGSIWLLRNLAGSTLYSATVINQQSWTVVGGSGPGGYSFIGADLFEDGYVHQGQFVSTNATWQMTNWINQLTIAPTNSGSSGQVLGLTGSNVAWVAQSGGSGGGGSNQSAAANNLILIATNTGLYVFSGVSQTNGFTTLASTNPSMVTMTNVWLPGSNALFAAIVASNSAANSAITTQIASATNKLVHTNDGRALSISNVNSFYYGKAGLSNATLFGPSGVLTISRSYSDATALTNTWTAGFDIDQQSLPFFFFKDGVGSPRSGYGAFLRTNGWADPNGDIYLTSAYTNRLVSTNQATVVMVTNHNNIFKGTQFHVVDNPTFNGWTNTIAIYGSAETTNNTTYTWNGTLYTNVLTGSYVAYNGSGWNIITRGGALQYALTGASPVGGTWTANTGPLPAPTNSSFGYTFDLRGAYGIGDLSTAFTNWNDSVSNFVGGSFLPLAGGTVSGRLIDQSSIEVTNTATSRFVSLRTTGAISASAGVSNYSTIGSSLVVTNAAIDRSVMYVTAADSSAVNGTYRLALTNSATGEGIWTNSTSTNMIVRLDPGANVAGSAWVLEGVTNASDFFYDLSDPFSDHVWFGFGSVSGTATVYFGTNNLVYTQVLISDGTAYHIPGTVSTNILYVNPNGNDLLGNRTNGYPFQTMYGANNWASNGDLVLISPGVHYTDAFYSRPGVHWEGAGITSTEVHINKTANFSSLAFVMSTNVTLGNMKFVNSQVINGHGSLYATNMYVHDVEVDLLPATPSDPIYVGINPPELFAFGCWFTDIRFDRCIARSRAYGWFIGETAVSSNLVVTINNCEAYCDPIYAEGVSNSWEVSYGSGGLVPIALSFIAPASGNRDEGGKVVVNGGRFMSMNGATNSIISFMGVANASRNSGLWISQALTNRGYSVELNGPTFLHGSTNATTTYAVLNESTNIPVFGYWNDVALGGSQLSVGSSKLTAGISAAIPTNSAALTTYLNVITLATKWTNTYNARASLMVGFTLIDAVGGNPTLVYSNFTTGEFFDYSTTASLVGNFTNVISIPDISPSNVIGFYDRSAGAGASATINKSSLKTK